MAGKLQGKTAAGGADIGKVRFVRQQDSRTILRQLGQHCCQIVCLDQDIVYPGHVQLGVAALQQNHIVCQFAHPGAPQDLAHTLRIEPMVMVAQNGHGPIFGLQPAQRRGHLLRDLPQGVGDEVASDGH